MRPELGRTQYCFGAVVLTLKATGWLFGLDTVSVRLTSCVRGPVRRKRAGKQRSAKTATGRNLACLSRHCGILTREAQLDVGAETVDENETMRGRSKKSQ